MLTAHDSASFCTRTAVGLARFLSLAILLPGLAHANNVLVMIEDINQGPEYSWTQWLTDADGMLFFTATNREPDESYDNSLWVTNAQWQGAEKLEGARIERFVAENPTELVAHDGGVFFAANAIDTISDPIRYLGRELWFSDGTNLGTRLAADIAPDSGNSNPSNLAIVGRRLFFAANGADSKGTELWSMHTDVGFFFGPAIVRDINPGMGSSIPEIATPIAVDGQLFFWADDGTHGYELWKSDGSEGGTVMVKDINTAPGVSSIGYDPNPAQILGSRRHRIYNPAAIGDTLYFIADDGTNGVELWKSDGSGVGTVRLTNINSNPAEPASPGPDSDPGWLTPMGTRLFFTATDPSTTGREVWEYDTVTEQITLVDDIVEGISSSRNPMFHDQMAVLDGRLYFVVNHPGVGTSLWRTSGAADGAEFFLDLNPDSATGFAALNKLTVAGNLLYMAGNDGEIGVELWETDGTLDGTLGIDINPGIGDSIGLITGPRGIDLAASSGRIFVPANGGDFGDELWTMLDDLPGGIDIDWWRPGSDLPLPPQPQADVSVDLVASRGTVPTNAVFSYQLTVRNAGPELAFGVEAELSLPVGLTFLFEARSGLLGPIKCTAGPASVVCDVGNLASGKRETFNLVVLAPASPGVFRASVDVETKSDDPQPFNDSDFELTTVVDATAGVDVSVSKVSQYGPVLPGRPLVYDLVVANAGTDDATGVVLTDVLPADTEFQAVVSVPEDLCEELAGVVSCDVGSLLSGHFVLISIAVLSPLTEMEIINTASVTSTEADSEPSNNEATAVVMVPEPGLALLQGLALATLFAFARWRRPGDRRGTPVP